MWLKGTALIPTPRICPFALPRQTLESVPSLQRHPRPNPSPRVVRPPETENVVSEIAGFAQDHPVDEIEEDVQNNFPDLFGCFSNEGFDQKRFIDFAEDFFSHFPESMDKKEFNKMQNEKAKIVSILAKNLYIICTLSREQVKNITSFWKTMMSFMTPESTQFVQKIHVSYTGCVREAQKRHDLIQAKQLEMFRDCCYFSLAIDTAQFDRDHFLS